MLSDTLQGEVAGAVLASPVESAAQDITKTLLPNKLENLLAGMEPYAPTPRTTTVPAGLSIGALQMLQNPGGM